MDTDPDERFREISSTILLSSSFYIHTSSTVSATLWLIPEVFILSHPVPTMSDIPCTPRSWPFVFHARIRARKRRRWRSVVSVAGVVRVDLYRDRCSRPACQSAGRSDRKRQLTNDKRHNNNDIARPRRVRGTTKRVPTL